MKTYDLYVESGPMMRKTMVHVPSLTGCIARGDTTAAALDAAPGDIRAFLGFIAAHGERVDPGARFDTRVEEHITRGQWLGNGIVFLDADLQPLARAEAGRLMRRLGAIHQGLRDVTRPIGAKRLADRPPRGRAVRQILAHLTVEGAYLRGVPGASRLHRQADEGSIDPLDALDRLIVLETERLQTMPDDERTGVLIRGTQRWTARYAVRRMLEHAWEHYVEICERLRVPVS